MCECHSVICVSCIRRIQLISYFPTANTQKLERMGDFKIFQDSVVNSSWATISICDEVGSNTDNAEESLDDTLPIDEVDDLVVENNLNLKHDKNRCQSINMLQNRAASAFVGESPAAPKDIREFQPVHCSSSIQLGSAGSSEDSSSFDFSPQCCSSKLDTQLKNHLARGNSLNNKDTQQNLYAKHPPIIREIAKLNPCLSSLYNLRMGVGSEEFKPEKCSTALSESEFKIPNCPTVQWDSVSCFAPVLCSTGIARSASMNHQLPSAQVDFTPQRCSTGVQDNSTAFIPLRCSTEKNKSAIFNPLLSSTATKNDDSNIPEFQYLRMGSEKTTK